MENLSTENFNKLKKAIILSDRIVDIGQSALEKFPENDYAIKYFMAINYLERFVTTLRSVNILLRQYEKNTSVETSIGLIIRASLLDFMNVLYLSTYHPDRKEFNKKIEILVSDQIDKTFKYLKLIRSINEISQDDYIRALEEFCTQFPTLFDNSTIDHNKPERKLKHKNKLLSATILFNRIRGHEKTREFSSAYYYYLYYSKYEHFGIITHFLQRKGFNHDVTMIIVSLSLVIRGLIKNFEFLDILPDKLENEQQQILDLLNEFDKLNPFRN